MLPLLQFITICPRQLIGCYIIITLKPHPDHNCHNSDMYTCTCILSDNNQWGKNYNIVHPTFHKVCVINIFYIPVVQCGQVLAKACRLLALSETRALQQKNIIFWLYSVHDGFFLNVEKSTCTWDCICIINWRWDLFI